MKWLCSNNRYTIILRRTHNVKKNFFLIIKFFIIVFIAIFHSGIKVQATVDHRNFPSVMNNNLQLWNNGTKINVDYKEEYMKVNLDTSDLEKGEYTSYLFKMMESYKSIGSGENSKVVPQGSNWEGYNGVAFSVKNNSNSNLRLNFVVVDRNENKMETLENEPIVFQEKKSLYFRYPKGNHVEVPPGFNGTLSFIFQSTKEENKNFNLSDIQSCGINILNIDNEKQELEISKFSLLSQEDTDKFINIRGVNLKGQDLLTIPNVEEDIYQYTATITDFKGSVIEGDVEFYFQEPIKGVHITKEGKLAVSDDALSGELRIYCSASDNVSWNNYIDVKLQKFNGSPENKDKITVPKPEDMKNYREIYRWGLSNRNKNYILISLGLIIGLLSVIIVMWRIKS